MGNCKQLGPVGYCRSKEGRIYIKPEIPLEIDLSESTVAGTPDDGKPSSTNKVKTTLVSPSITVDPNKKTVGGSAVLRIGDPNYPSDFVDPTEIRLFIESEPLQLRLGQMPRLGISGRAEVGSLIDMNFKVKLRYDTGRLRRAGLSKKLLSEVAHPGFDASGVVQLSITRNIPLISKLLSTRFRVSSPSTIPLDSPLSRAPAQFALSYHANGFIPVPAGAIFDIPSLGFGATGASWGETRGYSYTVGALGVPSPSRLTSEISTYLYLDGYAVQEIADGWELSVGLSVSAGKTFGAEKLGNDPSRQLARGLELWRKMSEDAWKPEAPAGEPTVIGTINLEKRF